MGWQANRRGLLGCVMMLAVCATSVAQPAESLQQGKEMNSTDGDPKAAFQTAFDAYRQELIAIEALRSEFQTADEARRGQINEELRERHPKSSAILDQMVDAAIAAYKAAPETDKQITDLLLSVAAHRIGGSGPNSQGGDDYEAALEVIQALIDGGNTYKRLPVWGIVAAYTTNNLDLATEYQQLALKTGAFSSVPDSKDKIASEVFAIAEDMAAGIERQRGIWEAEKKIREAEAAANDLPRVRLQTTEGEIVIELFENEAPQAVASFITLVKDGFYDGIIFHRVLPRFMAQGGDPTGSGSGGPGYSIQCECYQPNARNHFRGSLSMAHAGRDTGGSQFFLTFVPTLHLNGRHTVFGRVVEGFDVLAKLVRVNPGEATVPESKIVKAEVIRDRGHDYSTRFDKLPER